MKYFNQLLIFLFLLQSCSGVKQKKHTSFDDFTAGVEVGDPGKMPKRVLVAMKSGKKDAYDIDVSISLDASLKGLDKKSELIKFFIYKVKGSKKSILNKKSFKTPKLPVLVTLSIEDFPMKNKGNDYHYLIVAEISKKKSKLSGHGLIIIKRGIKTKKTHKLIINKAGLYSQ